MGEQCTASEVEINPPDHFLNLNGIQLAGENDRLAINVFGPQSSTLEIFIKLCIIFLQCIY